MMPTLLPAAPSPPRESPAPAAGEMELRHTLRLLLGGAGLIAWVTLLATLAGAAYAFLSRPVYETNMLFQVVESSAKEAKNIVGEMGSLFDVKTVVASEMELLRSRAIVARAVDELGLEIDAAPRYFPVLGRALASLRSGLSAPGLFGHGGYAWGSEAIRVGALDLPEDLLDVPLLLTADGDGRYHLAPPAGGPPLAGRVGQTLRAQLPQGPLALRVASLAARPGAVFTVRRRPRLAAIETVQAALQVTELGKQSGVINVSWQGEDAPMGSAILERVAREYLSQNAARKTDDAEQSLARINEQLPELKRELERSEARYTQFRNEHGAIDSGEEGKLSLQQLAAARLRRTELEQKRAGMAAQLAPNHPLMVALDAQLRDAGREIQELAGSLRALPEREQQMARLARDIKVQQDLYPALLNTAQQLRMITVGRMNNVHMVDAPVTPLRPVSPKRAGAVAIAGGFGLLLGLALVLLRALWRDAIDDPLQIETQFGLPVCAVVAHSRRQQRRRRRAAIWPVLAQCAPDDPAVESLRQLQAQPAFRQRQPGDNIVLFSAAGRGAGCSFVALNLAALLAAAGQRVLLVDADLRRGQLQRHFALAHRLGLADILDGRAEPEQALHREVLPRLDLLAAGGADAAPAELMGQPRLGALLRTLASRYALVLVDAGPLQPWSDTLLLARHADALYLVSRAGLSTRHELAEALRRVHHAGLRVSGAVFNDSRRAAAHMPAAQAGGRDGGARPALSLRTPAHTATAEGRS